MNPEHTDSIIRATMRRAHASAQTKHAMKAAFAALATEGKSSSAAAAASSSNHPPKRTLGHLGWPPISPRWTRVCAVLAIVALCTGGTAFAVVQLGVIKLEPQGAYQTAFSIDPGNPAGASAFDEEIDDYRLEFTNLPADATPIVLDDHVQKWDWDDGSQCFSAFVYYLDEAEPLPVSFVMNNERVSINGQEGVLFETSRATADEPVRELYVVYPDKQRVLWFWTDSLDANELQTIASDARLIASGTKATMGNERSGSNLMLWSDVVSLYTHIEGTESDEASLWLTASNTDMTNLHKPGDTFALALDTLTAQSSHTAQNGSIQVKVSNVQARKDIFGLTDTTPIPQTWRTLVQADGTLADADMKYLRFGDGKDTLDEVLAVRQLPVSIVQVDLEYTNTGSETLYDVLACGSLLRATQDASGWNVYDQRSAVNGTQAVVSTVERLTSIEPIYIAIEEAYAGYKNHVSSIAPGQTVTVRMSWLVPDEELDKILFNMSPYGGSCQFTEDGLSIGYVDIRQQ